MCSDIDVQKLTFDSYLYKDGSTRQPPGPDEDHRQNPGQPDSWPCPGPYP